VYAAAGRSRIMETREMRMRMFLKRVELRLERGIIITKTRPMLLPHVGSPHSLQTYPRQGGNEPLKWN